MMVAARRVFSTLLPYESNLSHTLVAYSLFPLFGTDIYPCICDLVWETVCSSSRIEIGLTDDIASRTELWMLPRTCLLAITNVTCGE